MKLQEPNSTFVSKILESYKKQEGDEINDKLLILFHTFNNDKNNCDVLIKVAALNKIYSTAITNIEPVVDQIVKATTFNSNIKTLDEYVDFVDKISKVQWTNNKGINYQRNNLSFASKYVHFLSGFETPIYDNYIWIIIKGYLGQKNGEKISFKKPKNFKEFYSIFEIFKKVLNLTNFSNYDIDKFLWHYGKSLTQNIEKENSYSRDEAKSELQKRIKAG